MAEVFKTFAISLDAKVASYAKIPVVEGDTGNRFVITLTDDGTAVDLSTSRVVAVFSGSMGTRSQDSWTSTDGLLVISGASHNVVTFDLLNGSYASGLNTCELQVYSGATYTRLVTSASFTFNARKPILNDTTIASTTEYPILVSLIDQVESLTDRAQADWTEADNTKGTYIQHKPVENVDFAAAAHASRHLIGGADALNAMPYDAAPTNLLINGGFDVWQRGTSLAAGAGGFLADRWNDAAVTATIAPSQQTFTVGQTDVTGEPRFYHRAVVVAGNNAASMARTHQRIEDVRKLAGRTVTISFWAKADASKYIAIEFVQNFGSGGSPSAFVSGIGAEKIAVTTSWQKITRTIVMPSIGGKTLGTTPNTSHTQFAIWYDSGADSAARASNIGYQSGTFDIANVQLNYGSVALPFVSRSFADELRLCQRYYEKSFSYSTTPAQNTGFFWDGGIQPIVQAVGAGQQQAGWIKFSAEKRIKPTMTFYNPAAANAQVRNLTRNSDCADLSYYGDTKGIAIFFTMAAGSAVGDQLGVHWTADAEL